MTVGNIDNQFIYWPDFRLSLLLTEQLNCQRVIFQSINNLGSVSVKVRSSS